VVEAEVGSGMNGSRAKVRRLLADPKVIAVVVEHRDRLGRVLVCGPCSSSGKRPEVPSRPGMILVRTFNVAGYFDGYVHRIATAGERASVHRAAALARADFLNAPGEPES
jgi:hypothetical protein